MRRIFICIISIIFLLLLAGCSPQPEIDISTTIGRSEDHFRQLEEIETTTSAFDGKKDINFRLMVEGYPTEEEAIFLFHEIMDSFEGYSNHQDIWQYYNGYFDIKNYDEGVIYEAKKIIDKEMEVVSK